MSRLFLRISCGILLALVVSSILTGQVLRWNFSRVIEERSAHPFHLTSVLLQDRFAALPQEAWPAEVDRLRQLFHLPVRLVRMDDTSMPPEWRDRFGPFPPLDTPSKKKTRGFLPPFFDREPAKPPEFIPLGDGRQVLIVGPFDRPPPFGPLPLVLMLGIPVPIVALVGFLLTFTVGRQLKKLEQAAACIGQGDLRARARLTSVDAIGSLGRQFDQMAERTQMLLESQQHLLQAVSHELRTPISRIGFNLEMLATAADEQERDRQLAEIGAELDELNQLVGELLLFVRFDATPSRLKTQPILLPAALDDLAARLRDSHPEVAIAIQPGTTGEISVDAHPVYFKRAVQNLLSNAIRHADRAVDIRYGRRDDFVFVEVRDDGPGIPQAARERIFEPFYRVDESRSRASGGAGLGLAIVRRIMTAHGGHVHLGDSPAGGACFVLEFPDHRASLPMGISPEST